MAPDGCQAENTDPTAVSNTDPNTEPTRHMWEALDTPLALALMILVPLGWGLGVEYAFELLRRRRRRRSGGAVAEDAGP